MFLKLQLRHGRQMIGRADWSFEMSPNVQVAVPYGQAVARDAS